MKRRAGAGVHRLLEAAPLPADAPARDHSFLAELQERRQRLRQLGR